jgi:3-phosphoshikimate 1-carboxyvinyltransferase
MEWEISGAGKPLKGTILVPPDKSISHRAAMFGAISEGSMNVSNFLLSDDCISTYKAFRSLGVELELEGRDLRIKGSGLKGLRPPGHDLFLGNSGTTMRIISGILAAQRFDTVLTGDASLSKRPMRRIIDPLRGMGADISSRDGDGTAPLIIKGRKAPLSPADYRLPVASAQVKSCILCASLYSSAESIVEEPVRSRDHTERMLRYFGCDIRREGSFIRLFPGTHLKARDISVPGDISSAAFFMVAALLVKGSEITLKNVGVNPTRTGLIDVLKRMGADINVRMIEEEPEPVGDITVKYTQLRGVSIEKEEIPLMIDEVPILAVAASLAEGTTRIEGIGELRYKETDRIAAVSSNLRKLGADIAEEEDRIVINGRERLKACRDLESFGDHRIAMSMCIAALCALGQSVILQAECASISYPDFHQDLGRLIG